MPELPEVETVRRGLAPTLVGARIAKVEMRRPDLRFPFPERFVERLTGRTIIALRRRGKYLLGALKALRGAMARAQKQPAYVVFPDRSLIEMAQERPTTIDDLAGIHGVGAAKLQKYGAAFLAVIRDHRDA